MYVTSHSEMKLLVRGFYVRIVLTSKNMCVLFPEVDANE